MSGTPASCAAFATAADRLGEHGLRVRPHGLRKCRRIGGIDEGDVDPEARQRVDEGVVRPAVQRRGTDDVIAGARNVEDGIDHRRLPAGDRERADAAFKRGQPLLEHVGRGIHDPRVDVAELLQGEEPRGVRRIVEVVRRRLVDRDGASLGRRVSIVPAVQGGRLEAARRGRVQGAAHRGSPSRMRRAERRERQRPSPGARAAAVRLAPVSATTTYTVPRGRHTSPSSPYGCVPWAAP